MSKKAAEDVAAYVRTLAAGRHRNVPLAEQAVNDSRAFTETEALNASPPLDRSDRRRRPGSARASWTAARFARFDGRTAVLTTRGRPRGRRSR